MSALTTPSVLAFEAKLMPSDALMYTGLWNNRDNQKDWQAINVNEKSVRGTISNRVKGAKASKIDAEVEKANLQTIDNAALAFTDDTLKLKFSLKVLGNLSMPSTCNNPDYQSALAKIIQEYVQNNGFKELAYRYAYNLANGRFLWRNRVGAEQVEVQIRVAEKTWTFDALTLGFNDFDTKNNQIKEIAGFIEQGLLGEKVILLNIDAFAHLGQGQTVFPSQELVMNTSGDKSKYLYQLNHQAAVHSQKIGNALRTIDTWYPLADEFSAIAIEPYGSVTNRGTAYRKPKEKTDFYTLLDNWLLKDKIPSLDEQHYVMAMLIRGGVFGE